MFDNFSIINQFIVLLEFRTHYVLDVSTYWSTDSRTDVRFSNNVP